MKNISACPIWLNANSVEVVDDGWPLASDDPSPNQDSIERLLWDITSVSTHFDQIREYWAKALDITASQWMILSAITDLDQGEGVSVKDVSAKLHVDPSFVTTQSKILKREGLLHRRTSNEDARVVLMSLSFKAYGKIRSLRTRQNALQEFIFADFDGRALKDASDQLALLRERIEKALLRLAADI
jgi:MarR family transcriptional regulator, organic hydroperoxide resistance regulator